MIAPSQFRVTRGEEWLASITDGYLVRRTFCSRCGSHLILSQGDDMRLRLGSLDTLLGAPLDMHVFVPPRADRGEILDGLPRHDERLPA